MSYSEKGGQVVLTISREDYSQLILTVMVGPALAFKSYEQLQEFLDRLNQGNPNYVPYQVGEKS